MNLCTNCLESGATSMVAVGPSSGPQRDPFQPRVLLCERCAGALIGGDFQMLAAHYSSERQVTRE